MKLFHISHTDLDGYGCHMLTQEHFKTGTFLNANYGLEVKLAIKKVLEDIKNENNKSVLLLITDVNLTSGEAKDLDKEVSALNKEGKNIELQLLDHHGTGQKSADKYDWYFLDTKRCATKIVYEYLQDKFQAFDENEKKILDPLVAAINAVDIWLDDEIDNFEFGKVLLSMISKVREINNILFANENRDFRIYLLKEAAKLINEKNAAIILDEKIYFLKKKYLQRDAKNDTIDNLSSKYLVHCLNLIKKDLSLNYKGHKGIFTYTLGSISIPANAFLKANPDYDFFIDISRKGNTSLRADGKVDVSMLASKLANGGGHPNASGCKFDDFRESINLNDTRTFLQNKLDKIS